MFQNTKRLVNTEPRQLPRQKVPRKKWNKSYVCCPTRHRRKSPTMTHSVLTNQRVDSLIIIFTPHYVVVHSSYMLTNIWCWHTIIHIFVYFIQHMCTHIWLHIYDCAYMIAHTWLQIHDCKYFDWVCDVNYIVKQNADTNSLNNIWIEVYLYMIVHIWLHIYE